MHPILLKYQLPADFVNFWSFAAPMKPYLRLLVLGFLGSAGVSWWALSPDSDKNKRMLGWGALIVALGFLGTLASVGLHQLRFIQLHTYGVLVAIGFLVGIVLAVREAQRIGENSERILDLAFWLLIAAMVGARAGYIATHWSAYAADFGSQMPWYQWRIFRLWEGGLLFFGGFVLALVVCWAFVRIYNISFWKLGDILVPSIAIGQFFGHLGGLAAGFSYGKYSEVPWRVAMRGAERHPTQMYEALGVLVIFFFLMWIRSNKKYHGQVFLWYLLLYPILSFGVEIFQSDACLQGVASAGDVCRAMVFNHDLIQAVPDFDILSWGQLFSVVAVVAALFFFATRESESYREQESVREN